MQAIELTQPRVIVIGDRKRTYKLTIGRIAKKDWLRYFEGILSTSEMQDGAEVSSFDSSAPRVELVEKNLIAAEGYSTPGDKPLAEISGWQSQIPLSHRLAAGDALVGITRAAQPDDENAPLTLGCEAVYLDAVWGAGEDGTMRQFHGLCHRFRTPSSEQQRRYSRDASRSRVIGGSRTGKTQFLGAQATLAELYDELIIGVDGYAVNGSEDLDRDAIVTNMDAYHKVSAALFLFSPAAPKIGDDEEKGK